MKIQNEIEVAASPDELFDVLADVERVAPLLPGASLEGQEDDDIYKGTVKVKVGPITTSYRGTLRFRELDYDNYRAVMEASGQEIDGQGNTEATITATVSGSDSKSVLGMETDLEVRGKAAQFGRGVIGNVSQKILDQFARNLESEVLSGGKQEEEKQPPEETAPTEEAEAAEETAPTGDEETGKAPSAKPAAAAPAGEEPLDMLSVVGGTSMLRQATPVVAGLALGLLVGSFLSSRKTLRAYQETVRLMHYGPVYGPSQWGGNSPRWWRR